MKCQASTHARTHALTHERTPGTTYAICGAQELEEKELGATVIPLSLVTNLRETCFIWWAKALARQKLDDAKLWSVWLRMSPASPNKVSKRNQDMRLQTLKIFCSTDDYLPGERT